MGDINDGGPAFPQHVIAYMQARDDSSNGVANADPVYEEVGGMTLRDYFAAKAMQALISKSSGQDTTGGKDGVPIVAKYAYEYADAILAARGPKP